jgi:hypothetical protein
MRKSGASPRRTTSASRYRCADGDGDGELRLLTTLTHFGTATDVTIAELTLEAFLPRPDECTARRLHSA